jgi:diguanylate cyclase (GGDEF)-like protein/putative nucleotidyltransferase with HDIG domain
MAGTIGWLSTHGAWQLILLAFPLVYATHLAYREHITGTQSSRKRGEAMAALHLRTIEALALAIDAKHRTSREHLSRMCTYSVEIARELGLSQDELAAVHAAALLHDVGNLAIPDHIMNKPGKLTAEEFEKVKIHPLIGAEILEQVGFPYPVVPIVKAHHERWNGSGYPLGISGEEIPIGARILAPIDCLNAQASERPYKTAIPLEEVIQEIARGAGSEFDPRVVEVLVRRYRELEDLTQADMKLSRKSLSRFREAPQAIFPEEASSDPDMDAAYGNSGFVSSIASAREEAQTLRDLLHILGNSLKLDETLPEFALRLRDLVDYDALVVYVLRGEKLVPEHATGEHLHLFASSEIPLGQGITGLAAQNRTPVLNGDPAIEPGYGSDSTRFEPLRSSLSIALHCNENVVGVLTLHSAAAEVYSQDDLRVLLGLQSKLALCVENALKFQQAESSAVTDFLTGLPNARSLFLHLDREIARCRRTGSSLAVMLCDLNGFKKINDQFGHLQGNKILKEFSDSLREVCREYDYVARMGGDEFVLIAPGMTREASEVRATLLNQFAVEVGIRVCGEPLLSLSVGTAFYMDDGWDADQLLSEADRRMYIVKQNHHAGVSNDSLPAGSPVSSLTSFAP